MSCLFDALSRYVYHCTSDRLRQHIAAYEASDPVLGNGLRFSQNIAPVTLEQYHRWITNPNSWGGALEIAAFAKLFQVNVEVDVDSTKKQIMFHGTDRPRARVIRIHWNGVHYSAIE